MSQLLLQSRHPEPKENLVEGLPVKEGTKLSQTNMASSWEDLMGLTWIFMEEE